MGYVNLSEQEKLKKMSILFTFKDTGTSSTGTLGFKVFIRLKYFILFYERGHIILYIMVMQCQHTTQKLQSTYPCISGVPKWNSWFHIPQKLIIIPEYFRLSEERQINTWTACKLSK